MSDQVFQVRWRGKVSGPFPLVVLREMLARGEVSLLHEAFVESEWISLEQLLATKDSGNSSLEMIPTAPVPKPVAPRYGPPPIPPGELYHVARHGHAQGPYPKSALKQLVAAGMIGREDLAWKQGMTAWKPLHELIELSPVQPSLPAGSGPMPFGAAALRSHDRPANNLAAPLAAFAWYHSNEVRKELHQANEELREMNENLKELQDDPGSGDFDSSDSWDVSDI